jgi:hypothetical protein
MCCANVPEPALPRLRSRHLAIEVVRPFRAASTSRATGPAEHFSVEFGYAELKAIQCAAGH